MGLQHDGRPRLRHAVTPPPSPVCILRGAMLSAFLPLFTSARYYRLAVTAEHEHGNTDPSGSAGLRGHPNTPSMGTARPPLSAKAEHMNTHGGEAGVTKSNVVMLSKANSGAFQHRGRKLVSSVPE